MRDRLGVIDLVFDALFIGFASVVAGGVAAIVFAVVGTLMGILPDATIPPIPRGVARERLRGERVEAEELGFRMDRRVMLDAPHERVHVDLDAGECLAVVAASWGQHRMEWLAIAPDTLEPVEPYSGDELVASGVIEGLVGHAQHCAQAAGAVTVRVDAQPANRDDEDATFRAGELLILRAPEERVGARLNRGWAVIVPE